MLQYSKEVIEHFSDPRNVGEIENADGMGRVESPVCRDLMVLSIEVENNRLKEVKFKTFGCAAAIAVGSALTEMAKGLTLDEALGIDDDMVAARLGGLPPQKHHCSNLGSTALHAAIQDHLGKEQK